MRNNYPVFGAVIGLILGIVIIILLPGIVIEKFKTNPQPFVPISPAAFSIVYIPLVGSLIGMVIGFLVSKILGKEKTI